MGKHNTWRRPLGYAAVISVFILGLFYYWFGLADRYVVFLYGHMADGITPSLPFDAETSGRYWVAGLVAAGMVMVIYIAANWLMGRTATRRGRRFAPPPWQRVWLLCVPLLAIGIPAVTMLMNSPPLPPSLAAACVAATAGGLALALMPGRWAAERPGDLLWLAADGLGLVPSLLFLKAVELPGRGLSISPTTAWAAAIGSVVVGAIWLALMSVLRVRRRKDIPGAGALLLAGLGLSYLLIPLAHYWVATPPGYRYISSASNFFAHNLAIQLLAVVIAAALAALATAGRKRIIML